MSENVKIGWIGVNDPDGPVKPMVWGYISYTGPHATSDPSSSFRYRHDNVKYFAFWSSIGGRILFREHQDEWTLKRIMSQRINKGYESIASGVLKRTMWKDFDESFRESFIAHKLEHL